MDHEIHEALLDDRAPNSLWITHHPDQRLSYLLRKYGSEFPVDGSWNALHRIGLTGMDGFCLHEFGDRVFESYRIISSRTFAGRITTNGHHGWIPERVLVPKDWRYDQLISAHAPSMIDIEVRERITLYGILSDTCDPNHGKWRAKFIVDGTCLATLDGAIRRTPELTLAPGRHQLEIAITQGETWGAHTGWAVAEVSRI